LVKNNFNIKKKRGMCSIHHEKKAIFIHINKTGGSYIAGTLEKYYGFKTYYLKRPDHDEFCLVQKKNPRQKYYENRIHGVLNYYRSSPHLNRYMNMTPEKWDSYFKFCFVRNPYDRIISGWNHLGKRIPFKQYVHLKNFVNDMEYIHTFMPQYRHIINFKNEIDMNFIGRFDNLENDFLYILFHLGYDLPIHDPVVRVNVKKHKKYTEYYDQKTLDKVNEIMFHDFQHFDFPLIKTIQELKEVEDKYNQSIDESSPTPTPPTQIPSPIPLVIPSPPPSIPPHVIKNLQQYKIPHQFVSKTPTTYFHKKPYTFHLPM